MILSFQHSSATTWRPPLLFSHSITILESPSKCKSEIDNLTTNVRETQAPNSSALVFVPRPQMNVHKKEVLLLLLILPPTPLWPPHCCAAPSNHAMALSSERCTWTVRGSVFCLNSIYAHCTNSFVYYLLN